MSHLKTASLLRILTVEKAIPRQFLDSLFTSNNPDQCSTFNGLFVDQTDANFPDDYKPKQGDPNTAKQIRLQSLFNRVPNNLNYNFVGLDKAVNGLKGTFFNPKLDGIEQPQAGGEGGQVDKNLNLWNRMGMVIDFLKMDVVQRVFVTGQSEVYAAFVRFDDLWGSCQDPINFAENYRKYIQGLLSDNIASIQQHASKVSNSLVQYATTTDSDGNLNSYGKAIRNLEQTYAPANLAFPTEPFLQFPETTADIKKRQAACTISAAPSTATSNEATTTAEATTSGGSAASASSASAASASSASAASVSSESVASVSSASVASVSSASVASVSSESVTSVASASSASAASAAAASSAAAAVPTGDCYLWDYASLAYSIQVTPINNWSGDDGGSLKKEEKGCGALTSWEFGSWSNGTQWATFNLPILIKAGCVERAIKSAGGPEGLKCIGMGFFDGFIQEDGSIGEAVEDVDDDTLSGLGGLGGNKILAAVADDDETGSTGTSGPHGLPSAPSPTASMLPLAVPQN
ncbi:hypothetical protein SLS56_003317 [Neofusicoccum ribis]|uniref:Uncharacterized protein n=1 Tax=Neofusicoccum ribis TaxID=45134 RepID=A0ABR3T0K5_9PEZI